VSHSPSHAKKGEIPESLRYFDQLPDSAHVRQPVVEALFGCSAATVWRRVADGRIPRPRKLSDRVTAWNVGELRRVLGFGEG
jgi:predicted DNA-binding transcriptional regulator AlpA